MRQVGYIVLSSLIMFQKSGKCGRKGNDLAKNLPLIRLRGTWECSRGRTQSPSRFGNFQRSTQRAETYDKVQGPWGPRGQSQPAKDLKPGSQKARGYRDVAGWALESRMPGSHLEQEPVRPVQQHLSSLPTFPLSTHHQFLRDWLRFHSFLGNICSSLSVRKDGVAA